MSHVRHCMLLYPLSTNHTPLFTRHTPSVYYSRISLTHAPPPLRFWTLSPSVLILATGLLVFIAISLHILHSSSRRIQMSWQMYESLLSFPTFCAHNTLLDSSEEAYAQWLHCSVLATPSCCENNPHGCYMPQQTEVQRRTMFGTPP